MPFKRLSQLLSLCLLVPFSIKAQTKFRDGYIVNLQGDTVKGQLKYKEWIKTPVSIDFKSNSSAAIEKYNVQNVLAFGATNLESYVRYTLPVSENSVSINDPANSNDTTKTTKTVFMKKVIGGDRVTLLNYTDNLKPRYFIAERDNMPVELRYSVYLGNSSAIRFDRTYRIQLSKLIEKYRPDDQSLKAAAENADYNERDIFNIIQKINRQVVTLQTSDGNGATTFFVGAGINYGTIKFTGGTDDFVTQPTTISNEASPFLNFGALFYFNKHVRRWYISVDGTFFTDHHKLFAAKAAASTIDKTTQLDYRQYTLLLSPMIGCNVYDTKALSIDLSVGPGFNFSNYNDYKYIETYSSEPVPRVSKYPDFEQIWVVPCVVKAGVTLNRRFDIFASVAISSSITNYHVLTASQTNYRCGLRYFLGKVQE